MLASAMASSWRCVPWPNSDLAIGMVPPLYTASVQVFLRYVANLGRMLNVAQAYATAAGQDPAPWLQQRMAPDMLPLGKQVEIAANFSLRAAFPLAGKAVVPYGDFAPSFAGLQQRLAYVADQLNRLAPADFEGDSARLIEDRAGDATVRLAPAEFLHQYAMPNFLFHTSMAYAILRSVGVPLGKGDFDGLHRYAGASNGEKT